MTRIAGPLAVIFIALHVSPASAALRAGQNPPSPESARQAIVRLENEWLDVRDVAVLGRILAGDFIHVLPAGFVTKPEELEFRKVHGFGPADVKRKFEDLRVRLYGSVAIANGVVLATGPGSQGVRRTRFTDVFVRRHGRWQAVNAQELSLPEP